MENPEEVLQALDEFQKMRPSEIPRELEEYLCWVAKTGDPVYQWSLVKPLFREKLTRVMTDFHESCPSLELAPCPNVEQFNYDIMKCALLELLDSFANAPFTVQRICELLTAPRKEYNRVDKFMRAIEKNILVVSTREPGPAARRSENGDGMVNGSVDDDALSNQSTHEVEMESWVKDCTTEASVTAAAGETNAPLLDSVITGKAPKIVSTNEEGSPISEDKNEPPTTRPDATAAETASQETPSTPSLVSPLTASEVPISDASVENSPENGIEPITTVADVPEAVMNEDTSSQPSLDSEVDDGETAVTRKLQTTFQPKDFVKEAKSPKFYADEPKQDEKSSKRDGETVVEADSNVSEDSAEDSTEQTATQAKVSFECQETVAPIVESNLEKRPRSDSESADLETGESPRNDPESGSPVKKPCSMISEPTERADDEFLASSATKTEEETAKMDDNTVEATTEPSCAERLSGDENSKPENEDDESKEDPVECTDDSLPEAEQTTETSENPKPIIEEPAFEDTSEDTASKSPQPTTGQTEGGGVTIEEAMDDDTRVNKSIIPDPIPIVEEPKEPEPTLRDPETSTTIITELPDDSKNLAETVETGVINVAVAETTIVEESSAGSMIEEAPIVEETGQDDITDVRTSAVEIEEKIEPAESMEVDGDESMPVFQQEDEPMEQEPGDLMKS